MRDYTCQEFNDVVNTVKKCRPSKQRHQMVRLVEYLDRHWDAKYRQYMSADYYDGENKHHLGSISSSFKLALVRLHWLPSKPSEPSPAFTEKHLYQGHELFDDTPMLHNLLSLHVPYVGATIRNANLVQELQIKSSVTATEMIAFLQQWSRLCEQGTPFMASVHHMRQVYLYLKREWDQKELEGTSAGDCSIKDGIQSNALIFVPDRVPLKDSHYDNPSLVPGHFYTTHQVCWRDQTTVLYRKQRNNESLPVDSVPKLLEPHYSVLQEGQNEIRQAFLSPQGPFSIDEEPKVSSLIALLKYISSESAAPDERSVMDFTSIVLRLAEVCHNQEGMRHFVYNNLKQAKVFPTQTNRWVAMEQGLFENNNPELAKHFKEVADIHFLRWPRRSLNERRHDVQAQETLREEFLYFCKIPQISDVVRTKVAPEGVAKPAEDLLWKLHFCVPLVQRFLVTHYPDHYKYLKQMDEKLRNLKLLSTEALYCQYSIVQDGQDIYAPAAPSAQGCELEDREDTVAIYILQDKVGKPRCLVPALMQLFQTETRDFKYFLEVLLLEDLVTEEDQMQIVTEYKLEPLTEGEPIWLIPTVQRQVSQEDEDETSESDGELSENEGDQATVQDSGLKSWPPQAAVYFDETYRGRKANVSARTPVDPEEMDRSADIIGEEEIQQVKRRHLHESFSEERSSVSPPLKREVSKPTTSPAAKRIRIANSEEELDSTHQPTPQTSRETTTIPPAASGSNTHIEVQQKPRALFTSDDVTPKKQTSHGQGANTYATQWKADVPAEAITDASTIDVSSLMQKASLGDVDIDSQLVPLIPEDQYDSMKLVGEWGERFVYAYLKKTGELPDGQKIAEVQWVNEQTESGNPYDLRVTVEGETVYVEVKSTSSADKELVAVSWKELKFAEEKAESFYLFRVYNAGRVTRELCWLRNLHSYLEKKPLRMFLEL